MCVIVANIFHIACPNSRTRRFLFYSRVSPLKVSWETDKREKPHASTENQ